MDLKRSLLAIKLINKTLLLVYGAGTTCVLTFKCSLNSRVVYHIFPKDLYMDVLCHMSPHKTPHGTRPVTMVKDRKYFPKKKKKNTRVGKIYQ